MLRVFFLFSLALVLRMNGKRTKLQEEQERERTEKSAQVALIEKLRREKKNPKLYENRRQYLCLYSILTYTHRLLIVSVNRSNKHSRYCVTSLHMFPYTFLYILFRTIYFVEKERKRI